MEATAIQHDALAAVETVAERTAALVGVVDLAAVPPGLRWSVRDLAAHLISATALYTELAAGASSPLASNTPESLAVFNDEGIADVADTDPEQLVKALRDVVGRFLDAAARRPAGEPVNWHAGIVLDTPQLVGALLAEYVIHGLDIAAAGGAPWPIDPRHVPFVLYGYAPVLPACVDPVTSAGHTATYALDLGTAGRLAVRFDDGTVAVGPADGIDGDGPYDCTIVADPATYLLVSTGRMAQSTAIALGLLGATGEHPELGLTFGARFRYP